MTRLGVVLLLAVAAVLAGCGVAGPDEPVPSMPPPQPTPVPTLSPVTTVVSELPRPIGTDGDFQVFEVSPQQYEIIRQRVHEAIVRQKLWDQGVRFGIGANEEMHYVLIDPGLSGLSARQILDRLLGNP